ncbi:MAG: hypothetical protein EB060_12755 [Proteobacteria bacterium]|nr:hypothetical protein [Pseudomonadota bacterium]
MKPSHSTTVRHYNSCTETNAYHISGDDIIAALQETGRLPIAPKDALFSTTEIEVRVPGGGDWSNIDLNLRRESVKITMMTRTES